MLVPTNTCSFVVTRNITTEIILLRQKFCRDKHTFVVTKDKFYRDKRHVCCDKNGTACMLPPIIQYRPAERTNKFKGGLVRGKIMEVTV